MDSHNKDREIFRAKPEDEAIKILCEMKLESRGDMASLLNSRSWSKNAIIELSKTFLGDIPHANGTTYEIFLDRMSVKGFIQVIKYNFPREADRVRLLRYYLVPAIRKKKNHDTANQMIQEIFGMEASELLESWPD